MSSDLPPDGLHRIAAAPDGDRIAGLMAPSPGMADAVTGWSIYFLSHDLAATLALATEHGGRVVFGPMAIPHVGHFAVLLDPQGAHALSTLQAPASQRVVIAIGPEGGWSPRDRQSLEAAGFQGLRLGPRVLRTETAGLAAIAALQARLGDL